MIPPSRKTAPTPPVRNTTLPPQSFTLEEVGGDYGQRVVLYGPGGIGKTRLSCLMPGPVGFIDAEESLPILKAQLIAQGVPVPKTVKVNGWANARAALQSTVFDKVKTLVVDSGTKLEEWALAYTLETVRGDKNIKVNRLEDYGYGKGYQHVFETFLQIVGDFDRHVRAGRNVVVIAHDCTSNVPNPRGENWLRYEPRLQNPGSGKSSIRLRLKEWADHCLFLGYDISVEDGKAKSSGSRTLYTEEKPFCMAKSRTTNESFDVALDSNPWAEIIK